MNRHLHFLQEKVYSLEFSIKEKMSQHDSSTDSVLRNNLYSEIRRMEKALSANLSLLKSEVEKLQQIQVRTYSVRDRKFKTRTFLISKDGLHKKRKAVKPCSQKCFDFIRNEGDTVVVVAGGRKKVFLPEYKYSSGMNVPGTNRRTFNSIQKTEIEDDILDLYFEEQWKHFPQDARMMEKDNKLKTLRFAERVCGMLFNNEHMLRKGNS